MLYNVITIPRFERELKRLAKKYISLKNEYEMLIDALEENPETGTPLGNNLYKIRLAVASKHRGKSGGARIITYFKTEEGSVYLLSIYDKGEKDTISDNDIQKILLAVNDCF
jgi:mRNA-degrading endonuclease RelE of RelBE toxin-antitoxin system